jgi:predicted DNA-binding transcriptional regulator AlpA
MRKAYISQCEQERRARQPSAAVQQGIPQLERRWVTGPTLRKILNISSVTLWRWRQKNGFPTAKSINGRLYFMWHEIEAWLEAQPDAA